MVPFPVTIGNFYPLYTEYYEKELIDSMRNFSGYYSDIYILCMNPSDIKWLILSNLQKVKTVSSHVTLKCHTKTCLKILVVDIPKEGLAGGAPPILFLV